MRWSARRQGSTVVGIVLLSLGLAPASIAYPAPSGPSGGAPAVAGPAPAPPPSRLTPQQAAAEQAAARATPPAAQPLVTPTSPVTGTWQALGPAPIGPPYRVNGGFYGGANSGRITALAVIPSGTHAGRVVAGSAGGGIWTSDNNGASWTARTDHAPSLAIGSLADDASHPDHLIAGLGEANHSGDSFPGFGVLSSSDGGTTWSVQNPAGIFNGMHIGGVAIDPANTAHLFAASEYGLFVSSDGGASWATPTDPSYSAVSGAFSAVVLNPATPSVVYLAGGQKYLAKSTDGGVHWAAANTGIAAPGSSPLYALALAPSAPSTLYAAIGSTSLPVKLYRSVNAGATWSPVVTPAYTNQSYAYGSGSSDQGWYDNVLAVDPANANHVLAGGITAIETTNGGSTWTNANGQSFYGPAANLFHPDFHALAFRADGKVWLGNDGGVFLYTPSSHTVVNANGNLNITQFYFGFNEVGGTVLAGSQDNGTARTASATVSPWTGIFSGDGGPSAITPNSPQVQFLESNQSLYVTTDGFNLSFQDITPPQLGLFTPPIALIPNTAVPAQPTVFYGGPNLYRSTNPTSAAPTWTQVTTDGTSVTAIGVSPSNPAVVYVGFTDGVIEVSTNGGVSFTPVAAKPASFFDSFVTGLSVDPANPKAITASFSFSDTRDFAGTPEVAQYGYSTTPGSGTWTVITGNLPAQEAVSRVVYDNGALVAATDAGVYATAAASGTATAWSAAGVGLPGAQVQDLFLDTGTGALYAVTHGRGAWQLPGKPKATKVAFLSASFSATATASPTIGPITVGPETAAGALVVAPVGGTRITLSSSSSHGVFSATKGGVPTTTVTVKAGQSAVQFYYGDTTAGTPTLTVTSAGLTPGTQKETIKP